MRLGLALSLLALAACSRPPPAIDDGEAAALREIAGDAASRLVVFDDLYDFSWRGAEDHAYVHGLPERAEKARKSRDDTRDAVAVVGGHVVALRVGGSKLKSLAPVARLPHLVVLDLHDGELADTSGRQALKELDHLGLAGNHLTSTSAVSDLPALRSVYLADNPIDTYEGFHDVPNLETVNLAGTRIDKIDGLGATPKLRALSLERTRVSRIENLHQAPELEELNLSRCPISKIEHLAFAPRLKFLNLWHDQIRSLAGLDELAPSVIYVGLGENPYDWNDPKNAEIFNRVYPGRIVTVL